MEYLIKNQRPPGAGSTTITLVGSVEKPEDSSIFPRSLWWANHDHFGGKEHDHFGGVTAI
jgi:hypothetical protein